jgi:chromosome segregation ATPase
VLAQDDLGLTELKLQYRTAPENPWSDLPLANFPAHPRDARVDTRWDASSLALLPGQSASFRLVVFDDNAVTGRGKAMSPEFQLRFPSVADLYQNVEEKQSGAQNTLEKVADQAKELQKTLDKLSRQQAQESAQGQNFERSEEMRGALQRQQEIGKQIDQAAQQLQQSIEDATERNAFDQDLMRKLNQVQELMEQIQSPEFKDAMRKMQQALENLDRRALERQMPEWRAENKDLVENLERTLDLLKKLREEEKLQELSKRAQDLKAQQDALNQEHEQSAKQPGDSKERKDLAERQQKAAE